MCGTTYSSLQSPNTLNYTGIWSLIELASLYTVSLSDLNGLSRLTKLTMSKGAGTDDSIPDESNLEASQIAIR